LDPTPSLAKAGRLAGDRLTTGAVPVPVRLTVSVVEALPELALFVSVTVSVPVRLPVAVGVKIIETLQLAPAASEVPQVLVCAKSPEMVRLVMFNPTVPVFVSVTD